MLLNYIKYAPVASVIFAITIIVSLLAMFLDRRLYGAFILKPFFIARGKSLHTLVTSGLIHADIGHLLFNMLSFYFFAFLLETYIGHWQFALLYILTLILSDIPGVIKHRDNPDYAVIFS